MSQFWTLFVTELKNRRKTANINRSFASLFWCIVKFVVLITVVVGILIFVFDMLIKLCIANNIEVEFLIFLFLIISFVQFIYVNHEIIKSLKSLSQSKEVLSMPIDSAKVFFVQVGVLYLQQIIVLTFTLVPILLLWGIRTQMTSFYYGMIVPVMLLLPIVPFFLAILISFPFSIISKWLQNRFLFNLILFGLLVAGGFYLYTEFLKFLLDVFQSQNYQTILTLDMINQIQIFASKLYPVVLLKNLLMGTNLPKSLLVFLNGTAIFFIIETLIAKKFYYKFLQSSIAQQPKISKKKIIVKKQNLFWVLIKKEIINVYRTPNYSFSFFTIALSTPIVVFYCNAILSKIGILDIGEKLYPAITLLIMLIFMALLTSFTATSVTREGKNFPITKFIPVSAKKQIYAKIVFYLMVELPVILFSTLTLFFSKYIVLVDLFAIFGIVAVVVFGEICFAIFADAKQPQFHLLTDNIVVQNNPNILKNVFAGLLIAFFLGICSVLLVFVVDKWIWYLAVGVMAILYMLLGLLRLEKKIEKTYQQIEW